MRIVRRLFGALHAIVRRKAVDADLDEELRAYLAAAVDAKVAAGATHRQALRAARAEVGSPAAVKDWVRDVGWETSLESVSQDARYAARLLRRSPGFTATAILTLGLGVGATTAIFTVVEAVILKPLPIADPDRVVSLHRMEAKRVTRTFTYPTFERSRDATAAMFEAAGASGNSGLRISIGNEARQVGAAFVTEDYFDVLGIRASRGRLFMREEHGAGAAPVVVLADAFWRTRMNADEHVIGRTIRIADTQATVVGVAPRSFRGLQLASPSDMFMPLRATALVLPAGNYLSDTLVVIGKQSFSPQAWLEITARLRPGASLAQAEMLLSTLALGPSAPSAGRNEPPASMRLVSTSAVALSSSTQAETKGFATLLAAVVSLVLLIGCANLAGLILARNEQRRRETAVRLALGARTSRVIRLFLVESLLLSFLGGLAGLLIAGWMLQAMTEFVLPGRIRLETLQLGLTQRVLLFAGGAALFTALVSGLVPALFGSRADLTSVLRTRGGATTRGKSVARGALVAAQVAISLVLIVGAVLFVRSLRAALATEVGVDAARIAYATVSFWRAGYDQARLARFNDGVIERLRARPGVERVTFGALPLAGFSGSTPAFRIDGVDRQLPQTLLFPCGPDYFATTGIHLVAGRAFGRDDERPGGPPAVVVNEAFARQAWPGLSAIGRRVFIQPRGPDLEVVGVARDGKYGSLTEEGRLALYMPWHLVRQTPDGARVTFIVRGAGNARASVLTLQREIRLADPGLPIFAAGTLEERISELAMTQRIGASLLGWFSAVACALAVLGIYGLIAYAVALRTNEIGVRIALGAEPGQVVRRMMQRSLVPVAAGIVAGLGGAYALTRLATSFLYGIAPHDPVSFVVSTAFLIVAATIASYVPARRAAAVDPMIALRAE
jgi:macrolide transport system ATP-binding/permease protein